MLTITAWRMEELHSVRTGKNVHSRKLLGSVVLASSSTLVREIKVHLVLVIPACESQAKKISCFNAPLLTSSSLLQTARHDRSAGRQTTVSLRYATGTRVYRCACAQHVVHLISGNPSPISFGIDAAQACYNLIYLELAACRITSLPANFSSLVPNVRSLNLNYNFLEADEVARSLSGLKRLRKLSLVGNRMSGTKSLFRMLNIMGQNIEMLDFRYV